jgi:hypothetical protein
MPIGVIDPRSAAAVESSNGMFTPRMYPARVLWQRWGARRAAQRPRFADAEATVRRTARGHRPARPAASGVTGRR